MLAQQRPCCRPFVSGSSSRFSSVAGRPPPPPPRALPQPQPQGEDQSDAGSDAAGPSTSYEFTYRGSDGRMKATFEQAFKSGQQQQGRGGGGSGEGNAPWSL